MNSIKAIIIVTLFSLSSSVHADSAAHKLAVNAACKADADLAGCPKAKVGSGLLKCLNDFGKKNLAFKISASCVEAKKKMLANQPKKKPTQ